MTVSIREGMSVYFKVLYMAALMLAFFVVYLSIADAIVSFGHHAAYSTYDTLKWGFAHVLFILTIFISSPRKYYFVIATSSLVLFTVCKDLFDSWKFYQTELSLIEFYLYYATETLLIASAFFLIFSGCIFTSVKALIMFKKEKPTEAVS